MAKRGKKVMAERLVPKKMTAKPRPKVIKKPTLLVLHGSVHFNYPTYAESPIVRSRFDIVKAKKIVGNPDLVFCQSFGQCMNQLMEYGGKKVVHIGGSPFNDLEKKRLSLILDSLENSRIILCVSKFLANQFKEATGWNNIQAYPSGLWGLDHVMTGVVPRRFKRKVKYALGKPPTVMMSMNLFDSAVKRSKWRGIPIFLEAVKDIAKKHGVKFIFVGRGQPDFSHLGEWKKKYDFNFIRSHHLDDDMDRWPGLLRTADIFAHPSMFDAWGRVVADAMCAGIPCLVFNKSAVPEVGDAPVVCNPDDAHDIAAKFQAMISSGDIREALGLKGHAEAIQKTERHRMDLVKILLEALG